MSKHQSVFLILGFLVVGIAIVVGINVTATGSQANREVVISELTNLASLAQKYYKDSVPDSVGTKSFSEWKIPESLDTTENGTYSAQVSTQEAILTGVGKEKGNNGIDRVKVVMIISPDRIISTKIEN